MESKIFGPTSIYPSTYQAIDISCGTSSNTLLLNFKSNQASNTPYDSCIAIQSRSSNPDSLQNAGYLSHFGTAFKHVISSSGKSFITSYNYFNNVVASIFKASESKTDPTTGNPTLYDAFLYITGTPSEYAYDFGGSLDTFTGQAANSTNNGSGFLSIGASRIDIGNVSDEINIGSANTTGTSYKYDTLNTQKSVSNKITIGNSLSEIIIAGKVSYAYGTTKEFTRKFNNPR
jgi:hypothetical protein